MCLIFESLNISFDLVMLCDISTKPPVCCRTCVGSTAEIWIYVDIVTKMISVPTCRWIVTARTIRTISVKKITTVLPPRQTAITTLMATNIHVFYSLANMRSYKIYDVKIYKFSSDVINIVNAMGRKTAGRAPVSGLGTKVIHHARTHSVSVPVW